MKNLITALLLLVSFNTLAVSFVWNGHGDGKTWEDDDNWVGDVAPGANIQEEVVVNDASQTVEISTDVSIGYLHVIGCNIEIKSTGILRIGHTAASTLSQTLLLELGNADVIVNGDLILRSNLSFHTVDLDGGSLLQIGSTGYMYTFLTDKGIYINSGSTFEVLSGGWANLPLADQAITNYGTIDNKGKINITFQDYGIDNYGLLVNQDTLTIQAISSGGLRGLYNTDSVNNQNYIFIDGCKENGIHSKGKIVNETTGYIEVKRFSSTVVANSKALHVEGLFENKGELVLNARNTFGLYNKDNSQGFINTGTCNIFSADSLGLQNIGTAADSSFFTNSGICNISQTARNGNYGKVSWLGKGEISSTKDGLLNYSVFTVTDSLKIDAGEIGIFNAGSFTTSAPVVYTDSKFGILNEKNFTITSTGSVHTGLLSASSGGYAVKNTDSFENDGELTISNGSYGLINENSLAGFHNNGMLTISGVNDTFLHNEGTALDTSYFFNTGTITMHTDGSPNDGIKGFGIFNTGKASFVNTGTVMMSQFWDVFDNIVNESNIRNEGVFDFKETQGMNINNSGAYVSTTSSSSTFQCDENFNEIGLLNNGTVSLNGSMHFQYADSYDRNMPLIENNNTFTNFGKLLITSNQKTGGLLNTGSFTNQDSLIFKQMNGAGIDNQGTFLNDTQGYIELDTIGVMPTGPSFTNKGEMLLKYSGGITVANNQTFDNQGVLHIAGGINGGLDINGANAFFVNQSNARASISGKDVSFLTNSGVVKVEGGHLDNQGFFSVSNSAGRGLALISGQISNTDTIEVKSIDDNLSAQLEGGIFTNDGVLLLNGENESSVTLFQIDASADFENDGTVVVIDAFNRGIYAFGDFTNNTASQVIFQDNTRNTGSLFYHSNISSPMVYNGSMQAINSQNCVSFEHASVNNGHLDLRSCGITMLNGTNGIAGHILSKDLSLIGQNDGIIEFFSDELYTLIGTNVITNDGLMVDHGDAFRNIKFNDGDALGFPVWNKGLFISPFYGTLSDGIKETINLNYTEIGSLPLSTTWYTDRAKTTSGGTWHLADHHFIPNDVADAADSLFFEIDMTGSDPVVISIPHLKPTLCPQPIITKILRTKPTHSWNDHTSWRGNRAPGYCERASFTGQEDIYIPSGYKVQINTFEFTPGIGPNRFLDIQSGSVFETNLLEFE